MSRSEAPAVVVLLSGGLDSATCLYWARARGWRLHALAVGYGQRHVRELRSARRLARAAGAELHELRLRLPWLGVSSLVGRGTALPDVPLARIGKQGIPSTYVPGRNTVFLALAVSLADSLGAEGVVIGANAMDSSGYPDCRPDFISAFERTARLGTRKGRETGRLKVYAPLLRDGKGAIVRKAFRLGVPLELTWSCYRGGRRPCGSCDSCKLRAKGFAEAGRKDPAL
ncbi:MAG TPA: 7-cyano-7-deazaguanine synthase QueC [Elusimicrobia bacterium]|nr:7-cyano-7-deazaguanine synthase QueC [Elusimicrobiota bacterium]